MDNRGFNHDRTRATARISLRTAGIFAGIGGLELGLRRQGHSTRLLSEIDATAQAVLRKQFKGVPILGDVRAIQELPECDLIAAGFPCQDLSQCGKTNGISGRHSSLVREVFRLVETANRRPEWILLENVPFMLKLDGGPHWPLSQMRLQRLGYRWAYRTVNAMAFGVPQRRLRVVLQPCGEQPNNAMFADNAVEPDHPNVAAGYGFYWTEGARGLGWAADAVPTLKGGSRFGLLATRDLDTSQRRLATIDIRDAERLQGFPVNWTAGGAVGAREGLPMEACRKCSLVRVASWLGKQLAHPGIMPREVGSSVKRGDRMAQALPLGTTGT